MVGEGDEAVRIAQKWGFGLAPIKPAIALQRQQSVNAVLDLLRDRPPAAADPAVLDHLSVVKGLYTRAYKQDQWDWFTVWRQLGRPGRKQCCSTSQGIFMLRTAIKASDVVAAARQQDALTRAGVPAQLRGFPLEEPQQRLGFGYLYVLSSREQPQMLKIGFTERDVEDRVNEINRATGVVIPYGVRAVWVVRNAHAIENAVHALLDQYRVRKDREFFHLDFHVAFNIIRDYVYESREED